MIEKHVTSLEISKRLKDLGFNKKSIFYWVYDQKNEKWDIWFTDVHPDEERPDNYIAAYVATELLEELPIRIIIKKYEDYNDFLLSIMTTDNERFKTISVRYFNLIHEDAIRVYDENLQNALAKMWIYLKENGLCGVGK